MGDIFKVNHFSQKKMKDPRPRPLHHFLLLFAEVAPSLPNNSQQSESQNSDANSVSNQNVRLLDKDPQWVVDGIGFKVVFLRILSFLDEYDLAQSIQPVCKLFQTISLSDYLWEPLLWSKFQNEFEVTKEEAQTYVNGSTMTQNQDSNSWKFKMVQAVRFYYRSNQSRTIYISSMGEDGWYGGSCAECQSKFEHRESYFVDSDSNDYFHIDCMDKNRFYEVFDNYNQLNLGYHSWMKDEIINTFFKRRMLNSGASHDHDSEEEEEPEAEETEFTCDNCSAPISRIRYHCLDCKEDYDLCGLCCEKLVYQQMGFSEDCPTCIDHPDSHTFLTVGEEYHDTYSCNQCKEKIRGYRYSDMSKDDYDLCSHCFKFKKEPNVVYERYDLDQNECVSSFLTVLTKKLHLKELKEILEQEFNVKAKGQKQELSEDLLELLEEKQESGNCPTLCYLVSKVPRLCVKDENGNTLGADDYDAQIFFLGTVEESLKSPKKKQKLI